jgi:hypothetical protein
MCYLDIRPSGIFRSVDWYLVTDVSGILPIFKRQQRSDMLPWNVGSKLPMYAEEKSQKSQDLIYTAAEAGTRIVRSLLFSIEDSVFCATFVD